MRGTSKSELIPYVLVDDLDLPKEEQTTFMLKAWGGLSGARIAARYAGTERVGRKGFNEIKESKRWNADKDTWLEGVIEIKNYSFSKDFPELEGKGWIKSITDDDTRTAVAKDITLDQYNEIVEALASAGSVSVADKKK